ncbi:MAG: glycosyltransferase family 1 protein [Bacillus sp. (in: firmicutes)]
MRIGVNLLNFSEDRFGGVEQYVKNLIWHLANSQENVQVFLFLTRPFLDVFPNYHDRIKRVMVKHVIDPIQIRKTILHNKLDLWFSPLHRSYIPDIPIPSVVTIHDLLHTSYPQYVSENLDYHNQYYQQYLPSFDAIITVSNFSKDTIMKHLHIPEEKVHVIYQDVPIGFERVLDEGEIGSLKEKYKLPEVFGIYPASYNAHKNHLNLLKAILFLREQHNKEIFLVLTGYTYKGNTVYQQVVNFLNEHHLEKQIKIVNYIPQREMYTLYSGASFLVFPSLYEGFGIPLVEAMKAKCPIACSNRGSIPEIVGEAALQFNPENVNEIAQQILQVLELKTRVDLIEKSTEQVKQFSWEKSVRKTLEVFNSVLQRGREQ